MSVWQDYLLSLAYVYPTTDIQTEITDRVFQLLKILLHHAIKLEYGGWRVWIDTLSILHGRVRVGGTNRSLHLTRMPSAGDARRLLPEGEQAGREYERRRRNRGKSECVTENCYSENSPVI